MNDIENIEIDTTSFKEIYSYINDAVLNGKKEISYINELINIMIDINNKYLEDLRISRKKGTYARLIGEYKDLQQQQWEGRNLRGKARKRMLKIESVLRKHKKELSKPYKDYNIFENRLRAINRIKDKIKSLENNLSAVKYEKVNWKIFPADSNIFNHLIEYSKKLNLNTGSRKFYISRIEMLINQLKPVKCYVGLDEFEGYLAFHFNNSDKIVCENPFWGNAIYILSGQWKELMRLTKSELLKLESEHVVRLYHRGNWIDRLADHL